jgi:hypothetical protein
MRRAAEALANAERRVLDSAMRIERQHELSGELRMARFDTRDAERLLAIMVDVPLEIMQRQVERIWTLFC